MTADDFIAWAVEQPKRPRYELVAGELVLMAPERAAHARVKGAVWRALDDALRAARLPCEAYLDGMAVKVDDSVVYEPDALVRCGEPLPDDAVKVTDPMIVVEVLSPSSLARDTGAKLEDYFRLTFGSALSDRQDRESDGRAPSPRGRGGDPDAANAVRRAGSGAAGHHH